MKARNILFIVCAALVGSCPALSQVVTGRVSVAMYTWERFDTVGVSNHLARGFSNLQFDVVQHDVSFHTYLSATSPLTGASGDEASVRVSNAYLRWKNINNVLDVNLGRVPIFAGVGIGTVDGLTVKARGWNDQIRFTGYGGANVPSDLRSNGFSDLNKNFLIGGQILGMFSGGARVGLSYVNRHINQSDYTALRPDSLFNPVAVLVSPGVRTEQVAGLDASFDRSNRYTFYGRYEYDLNLKKTLRRELRATVNLMHDLLVTGTYIFREPRILYSSFFSMLPTEPVHEYEGGLEYTVSASITCFGRLAYVKYFDDVSRRLSLGVNHRYGSVSFSGTNGYAGQLTSFYAQGMYPLMSRLITPTVGISFSTYRLYEGAPDREDLLTALVGVVARPMKTFSADAQIQWLKNKIAERDVRVLAKLTYWFSCDLSSSSGKEEAK